MKNTLILKTLTRWRIKFVSLLLLLVVTFLCLTGNILAQEEQSVSGTVTDANTSEPLPGVTVIIKGSTLGTITDLDGNFIIQASPNDVLEFSYIGYLNEQVPVGTNTVMDVSMVQDIIGLDEVVVTGYGVQKKSDITGSIASVSGDEIVEVPVSGVDHALQGKAAGVYVMSRSGLPGESAKIQIRGIPSVNTTNPLIIVDGVPGSLDNLNSNDIESIEVLKDASSAAIYGVSGGSGVVLVTTKKGKSDKMLTSFNFYSGVESPTKKIDLMNSQQWIQVIEEREYEDSRRMDSIAETGRPDTLPNYDWQEIGFQPAWTQSYDLSFQGGSEKSNFLVSSSYLKQTGIVRNSDYRRFTIRVNSEHKLTKRITYDQKLYYANTINSGFPEWQWSAYYDGPFRRILQMAPIVPDYNPDGSWANSPYGGDSNPLALLDMIDRKVQNNNFSANLGLGINIVKGLTFTTRFAGYMNFGEMKEFQDVYYNTTVDRRDKNKLLAYMDRYTGYSYQNLLNYDITIAKNFNISLLAGMEVRREWNHDISGERDSLPSSIPEMQFFDMSDDNSTASQIVEGGGDEKRYLAYFGRLNFDYKGKYLLTANIRRDGVYNLSKDKRIGYFPSVSLGWKFSEEGFMQNQSFLSFGKIRYGYGQVGNFPRTGYPYLSIVRKPNLYGYSFDDSDVSSVGAAPVQIENPGLGWETVHMSNVGVDLAFLSNRISFSAEYYKKVNEDMIMLMEVPYYTGTYSVGSAWEIDNTYPEVNIGSIQNSGFEFTLGYKLTRGDLKGSFDLNFSTLKNEVLDLATDSMRRGSVHNITPINMTRVGGTLSEFWGWETDGMFSVDDPTTVLSTGRTVFTNQPYLIDGDGNPVLDRNGDIQYAQPNAKPGDARFKDVNGDGRVLTDDDKVMLGSPIPKFFFGFSFNLEYKGFDFSAFFNGVVGNKIFDGTKQYLYYYQGHYNKSADFVNRYVENDIYKYDPVTGEQLLTVPENRNTDIFRNDASNYAKPIDFYIEDGSYLRLRNLILGYTIPQKITNKIKVEKFRVYVGARNLFTITKYQGLNPEAAYNSDNQNLDMGIDVGVYPVTRMFLFGVNLQF